MSTKTTNYLGLHITVPSWTTYMAMDENNFIYAFDGTPTYDTDADEWDFTSINQYQFIGTLQQLSGMPLSALQVTINL